MKETPSRPLGEAPIKRLSHAHALSEALKSAPQGLLKREERDELKGVVIKGDDLNRGGAIKGGAIKGRAIKSEGDAHLRRA